MATPPCRSPARLGAAIVLLVAALAPVACLDLELPGGPALGPPADSGTSSTDAGPLAPVTVVIDGLSFSPKEVHVKVGQQVIWDMRDTGTFHFVTEGSPGGGMPGFESPRLDTGQVWSRVFDAPGTYLYFCSNHSTVMKGNKIVVEP